jgi:membrane-bound lytic murein transglycosylase D
MVKEIVLVILFCGLYQVSTATEVPSEMEFAGMELRLTESVRKRLQADVDMITRGVKAFQLKVDRADLYFPIIEKVFKEERLPDDFKFLALQESSLISDAVSSSNAVGYWQFKKETALEVGLRVDYEVDERMNIVASSRGAAKYLNKNNSIYFNNWIYALLAYNLGAGGAKSKVEAKYKGVNKMVIDDDMHWYVIRCLAHKLAYKDAVGKNFNPPMSLAIYEKCNHKTLEEISLETRVGLPDLEFYNKWLLKRKVPGDKEYCIIVPVTGEFKDKIIAQDNGKIKTETEDEEIKVKKDGDKIKIKIDKKDKKRKESELSGTGDVALIITINGVKAIKAKAGDTPSRLAIQGGISFDDFLRYNDLKSFAEIEANEYYFLQPKRNKGLVAYHTVQPSETFNDISQKYAMRIQSIRSKNRMSNGERLEVGRVLWLRKKRPKEVPVEIKKIKIENEKKEDVKVHKIINPIIQKEDTSAIEIIEPEQVEVIDKNVVYHIVKQGETLYGISKVYSTTVENLKLQNDLSSNDLVLGQKLIIKKILPQTTLPSQQIIEHVIQPGETLYQISKKYGVSVENIQLWNNKNDNQVSIGEKIIIKKP